MANIGFSFNAADYKPLDGFTLVPKGEYNAILLKTEIDQTNAEKPKLVATFQIVEGPEKGLELSENLFLWLPKDGSKSGGSGEISRRKMTSIVNAIGFTGAFNDTAVLHGKPLTIKTDIRFSPKNDNPSEFIGFPDIKSFKPYAGPGNVAGADANQPQAPVAPAAPAGPAGFGGGFAMPQAPAAPAPVAYAPQGFAPAAPGAFPAPAAPAPFQPVPGAPSPFGAPGR